MSLHQVESPTSVTVSAPEAPSAEGVVFTRPARRAEASRLARWSLPLVLSMALAGGLLHLLIVPPWQGPDEPSHFAYVGLLHRHNLDDGAVQRLDFGEDRRQADGELVRAVTASMERHNFPGYVPAYGAPGSELGPDYAMFQEVRQPAPYYWLSAAALRLATAVGIAADPYVHTEAALVVVRVVSLLLSLGVVALAWLAGALISGGPWLRLLMPLTVALFPQHLFMMSVANNDVLAELVLLALFVTLLALLVKPYASRAPALAGLAVVLTGLSLLAKGTAVAAALPLLGIGLAVWVGMLRGRKYEVRSMKYESGFNTPLYFFLHTSYFRKVVGAVILLLLLAGAAWVGVGPREGEAANWTVANPDNPPVKRVNIPDARDGSHAIELAGRGEDAAAVQMLVPPVYHPAMGIQVEGWARLPETGGSVPADAAASIVLYNGKDRVGRSRVSLDSPGVWKPLALSAAIAEGAGRITLKLVAEGDTQGVQFDDMRMWVGWPSGYWQTPFYRAVLLNGSAEKAIVGIRPPLDMVAPREARQMVGVLLNQQQHRGPELWSFYAQAQYRSFWGSFGWLAIPLPDWLYMLLGAIASAALVGLVLRGIRLLGRWSAHEWLGLVCLLCLVAVVLVGFSRQTMLLSLHGIAAFPQGRYLFVLLAPLAWLAAVGLWEVWSLAQTSGRRLIQVMRGRSLYWRATSAGVRRAARGEVLGAGLWVIALLLFEIYCLLGLILPYYRR